MSDSCPETSSTSKTRQASKAFLAGEIPHESIVEIKKIPQQVETRLVSRNAIPEPFRYHGSNDTKSLAIKYSPDSSETTDILLGDVVIEYKSYAGEKRIDTSYNSLAITYFETYVSVGIPLARYEWLLETVRKHDLRGVKVIDLCEQKDDEYAWISAQLPCKTNEFHDKVMCYIYNEKKDDTVAIGTIDGVLTKLKSNLIGYGQFNIRVFYNFQSEYVMSLFLNGFQMKDLTTKQSCPKPFVSDSPSTPLLESLKKCSLYTD